MTAALVIGESLVDIVVAADGTTTEHPGGSAANAAVALARLGRDVGVLSSWADDARGRTLADRFAADRVTLAGNPWVLDRTSTAAATLGVDGSASYLFDLEWRLAPPPADLAPLVVHTCSLGAVLAPGAGQVLELLARLRETATVTYDINARPALTGTGPEVVAAVESVVRLSDVVKASDEDLADLYPQLDLASAAGALLALGPAAVIVTRGVRGATWFGSHGEVNVPARHVDVVDTIGAGDTFSAALIDALWSRGCLGAQGRAALRALSADEKAAVLRHAVAAAAVTVSRAGANPPFLSELQS